MHAPRQITAAHLQSGIALTSALALRQVHKVQPPAFPTFPLDLYSPFPNHLPLYQARRSPTLAAPSY